MSDAVSFADRAARLIADFQHAMDSNAPVSGVMMAELKAVLDIGIKAHADCAALHASANAAETSAAALQAEAAMLQGQAASLVATIHGGQ